MAGFGRHLDVEPAHSAGVQAEGRTAVAASRAVDAATAATLSHNCKTRGLALSSVAAAIGSSLSLQALPLVRRSRGGASDARSSKDIFLLVIIALEVAVLRWLSTGLVESTGGNYVAPCAVD